jgi:predicted transcriptional regulator
MEEHISDFMKLDDEFELFIHKYVNSFVKWELVQFFYNHQNQSFGLNELAQKLNRSSKTLNAELSELATNGLLVLRDKENQSYQLISKENDSHEVTIALLNRFIQFCKTREGRLRVIYKILKDGKQLSS